MTCAKVSETGCDGFTQPYGTYVCPRDCRLDQDGKPVWEGVPNLSRTPRGEGKGVNR